MRDRDHRRRVLPITSRSHAEHDHRRAGLADHAPHRPCAVGFERTSPAKNDEVAVVVSREVDDSRAGLALSNRKTNVDPILAPPTARSRSRTPAPMPPTRAGAGRHSAGTPESRARWAVPYRPLRT